MCSFNVFVRGVCGHVCDDVWCVVLFCVIVVSLCVFYFMCSWVLFVVYCVVMYGLVWCVVFVCVCSFVSCVLFVIVCVML